MNMQRTLTRILGALGASALMLSATVIPAEASKPSAASDCPAGWFCLFDGNDFTGRMLKFQHDAHLENQYSWGDSANSWVNKTPYSVRLVNEHWYGDEYITAPAGARNSDMGSWRNVVDRINVLR